MIICKYADDESTLYYLIIVQYGILAQGSNFQKIDKGKLVELIFLQHRTHRAGFFRESTGSIHKSGFFRRKNKLRVCLLDSLDKVLVSTEEMCVPHRDIRTASYGERIVYSPQQQSACIQSYGVFQAFLATLAWYTSTGYVWLVV